MIMDKTNRVLIFSNTINIKSNINFYNFAISIKLLSLFQKYLMPIKKNHTSIGIIVDEDKIVYQYFLIMQLIIIK